MSDTKTIILASSSPRRKELLSLTGLKFSVDNSDYEEDMDSDLGPHALARFLSLEKAKAVAFRYKQAIIISADTFIVFKGKLLGKPHTEKEAGRMLRILNGKTHSVITGFTIMDTGRNKRLSRSVETRVSFKRLTEQELDNYVKTKEPLDKAGAYAIQGLGAVIIKKIEGDYFNVIGLPLSALMDGLKKFGVRIL
jgi:septum formation protein